MKRIIVSSVLHLICSGLPPRRDPCSLGSELGQLAFSMQVLADLGMKIRGIVVPSRTLDSQGVEVFRISECDQALRTNLRPKQTDVGERHYVSR